jgi:hypothetical protein
LDASAEKGSTTGTRTLFTLLLCRFDRKPVEKPYFVDFAPTPIKLIDPAEGFDLPDQRSRILVLPGVNHTAQSSLELETRASQ